MKATNDADVETGDKAEHDTSWDSYSATYTVEDQIEDMGCV